MKSILKFTVAMALINMAGRAFNGENLRIPPVPDTVECIRNIASDFAELAEQFGCTFTVSESRE